MNLNKSNVLNSPSVQFNCNDLADTAPRSDGYTHHINARNPFLAIRPKWIREELIRALRTLYMRADAIERVVVASRQCEVLTQVVMVRV